MATVRPEVLWCPGSDDTFLTWSTNIQLYQVQSISPDDVIAPQKIKLSNKTAASLLATNSDYQYIKCVACYNGPHDGIQQVIAVGQANGRVALTSFNCSMEMHGIIGKEFIPKFPRAVNALAWNPKIHQYLAVGLEKATRDQSLVVLDIVKGFPASCGYETRTKTSDLLKPIVEWSSGEVVHSVEFSMHDPWTLLGGINYKHIKLFDLREEKVITSVATKAVHGICSDPFDKDRFASHIDNTVHIWDLRNTERPLITLQDCNDKSIHKLSWCPTRRGLLGSLSRESASIRLYQLFKPPTTPAGREDEMPVLSRSISPEANAFVSSFSWHPSTESRVITASYSGKILDHIVHERIAVSWAVMNNIGFSQGKRNVELLDENNVIFDNVSDISMLIKQRALKKYGLHRDNLSLNGDLTNDRSLRTLWTWLEEARRLAQSSSFRIKGEPYSYQGVVNLLSMGTLKSEVYLKNWESGETNKLSPAKMFRCEERNLALTLCLWGSDEDGSLEKFLTRLEHQEEFSRAAAVAVFNLHLPRAIRILKNGALKSKETYLNTTAMALAGFTNERKALWRETCLVTLKDIEDQYLKAMFTFLTGDTETYAPILQDKRITINDRVAFACKYLSDSRLLEFIHKLTESLTKGGHLDGILLTGLNSDGIDLLQRYIDSTSDVQTPSLIAVHVLQSSLSSDPRVEHWVESYRSLLNSLRLWKYRAQMDVIMNHSKQTQKVPLQVYVSCNFCYKNTMSTYNMQSAGRARIPFARFGTGATSKLKMTSCPHCKKPLPRCSLCLQHMGTPSRRGSVAAKRPDNVDGLVQGHTGSLPEAVPSKALSKISSWFSWCQTCCHGGHAQHMMQWFKEHNECPVTSCSCKCLNLDGFNLRNIKGF